MNHEAALARDLASKNSDLEELREQSNLDVLGMQKHHQAKLHAHQQSKDDEIAALKGREQCKNHATPNINLPRPRKRELRKPNVKTITSLKDGTIL